MSSVQDCFLWHKRRMFSLVIWEGGMRVFGSGGGGGADFIPMGIAFAGGAGRGCR